jgi:hypothetical protein
MTYKLTLTKGWLTEILENRYLQKTKSYVYIDVKRNDSYSEVVIGDTVLHKQYNTDSGIVV